MDGLYRQKSEEEMSETPGMPPMGAGSGGSPPPTPQVAFIVKPRPKWHALRAVAGLFKILAWMIGGGGLIAVVVTLVVGNQAGSFGLLLGLGYGVVGMIGAGIVCIGLYGFAEVILVLVAIEQNTRQL